MNGNPLNGNFQFRRIAFNKVHYTNSTAGSPLNYVALMLKGTARIVSRRSTIGICPGDLFFIPIRLPYESYWYGQDEIEFLSFGFTHLEAREQLNFGLQVIDCGDALKAKFRSIPTEGAALSCGTLGAFYSALAELLPCLSSSRPLSRQDEIVRKAREYIAAHTDCTVAEAAQSCFVSEPYLYALFREKAGCTPNEYRLRAKCSQGMELLLTTDKTVEEISALIGMSSASHFRRTLKALVGLTPKEVRQNSSF